MKISIISNLIFILIVSGCKSKSPHIENSISSKTLSSIPYNNCFVMYPINNSSSKENFTIDIAEEKSKLFTHVIEKIKQQEYVYDTGMDYTTSFKHQKLLSVSDVGFSKLKYADSCYIDEIYQNSYRNTGSFSYPQLAKTYDKFILGFGQAIVFEYEMTGVPSQSIHYIYLILKKHEDNLSSDPYKGFALCSDGIKWYKVNDKLEILSLVTWVHGTEKQFEVLMHFKENKFIPIGHSKIGDW